MRLWANVSIMLLVKVAGDHRVHTYFWRERCNKMRWLVPIEVSPPNHGHHSSLASLYRIYLDAQL